MKLLLRSLIFIFCLGLFTGCTITITDSNNDSNVNDEPETTEETEKESELANSIGNQENEGNDLDQNENNDTPSDENSDETDTPDADANDDADDEVVAQNEAFKVYEPAPDAQVEGEVVVRGLARVFEGTVQYSFEDGHIIYDEGFTTASAGGPEWGEFEIVIDLSGVDEGKYRVVLFEHSAKDGSVLHELIIPHIK